MKGVVMAIFAGLLSAACSVIGVRSGTEEPAFEVVGYEGGVELRRYGPRLAASMMVPGEELAARNEAFRPLAAFIFGENEAGQRIGMTAPVVQASERIGMTAPVVQSAAPGGGWRVTFLMPARYTLDTLPKPTDQRIAISTLPESHVAVLRFAGSTGTEAVAERKAALLDVLSRSTAWRAEGEAEAWFYDPPWTLPPLRRNEVVVAVTRR